VEEYLSTYNPDLPFWMQFDWLLLSILLVMSLLLPPFFAILAHGMAAVAFWLVVQRFWIFEPKSNKLLHKILKTPQN